MATTDSLRSIIQESDGVPQQVFLSEMPYAFQHIDFSKRPQPQAQFEKWLNEKPLKTFDLDQCLFETILIKLSETRFVWYLNQHHIATDGSSIAILFRRLSHLYETANEETKLAAPAFQDYLKQDQRYRASAQYFEDAAYWKKKLAATVEPLRLFNATFTTGPGEVQRLSRSLGVERSRQLKAVTAQGPIFHKSLHISVANAVVALLFAYLHRLSGNQLLSIAAVTHNRRTEDLHQTVGLIMGLLPLRVSVEENETFVSLIQKVTKEAIESAPHGRYTVQNSLHKKVYDVAFNYLPGSFSSFAGGPVDYRWLSSRYGASSLILNLHDFNATGNYTLDFDFLCSAFTEVQRERTIQHFFRLLDAFLENPERSIHHVPFLSPAEEQTLAELNSTEAPIAEAPLLHHLFEAQVEKTPAQPAVAYETQSLTYSELNARANQLARHLKSLHVEPEAVVGICLERSPEIIIAILAVLKAGGTYLPLDPSYPKERLAFMLQDARPVVTLTQQHLLYNLPPLETKPLALDVEWAAISKHQSQNLTSQVTPDSLAYLIYTSGSTGTPKGVQIPHRAVVNFVTSVGRTYAIDSQDRVLQFASMNFDASVEDIFSCLTRGATLMLRTDSMLDSMATFLRKCVEWNVTVLSLPTAFWHELIARAGEEQLTLPEAWRLLVIGGERAIPERLAQWRAWAGDRIQLINTYGPTEATVVATLCEWPLTEPAPRGTQEIAIGRPIANTQVYLLDPHLQPVPIGVAGELHIGGLGLARGYLNQPNLTAEKFIPNPFSKVSASRLYKTGDLARLREDGQIEFVGRTDQQVKIRGFRIEPGEIEAVLNTHPAVAQAMVVVREDQPGQKQLAALFTVNSQASLPKGELRKFLAGKMPDYMVPASFQVLEKIPLNGNGKVDRTALAALPAVDCEDQEASQITLTPLEEIVAGIWCQVLGLKQIGLNENFFEIGGHSLVASRIISRIWLALKTEIPMSRFFAAPTIADLARLIQTTHPNGHQRWSTLPIRHISGSAGHAPLSYAQQRLWFLDQLELHSAAYNIPVAITLIGPLNLPALKSALQEVVSRHEILRTTFTLENGQPVQVITPRPPVSVPVLDLSAGPESERLEQVMRIASAEASQAFDLSQWPLMRTTLLHLGGERHVFLVTMQHIISDGWSLGVFFRELSSLYTAACEGQPAALPELSVQYADFALWQQLWLETGVLESELSYWKKQLADAPPVLEIPVDYPRPAIQTFRGAQLTRPFPAGLAEQLKKLSRSEGVTLFMTMLAAFQTVLSRHTGQTDIVIGTASAGRQRPEIEGLIGFFVNTLVLRTDLSGNPTFKQLVQRVRETFLGAYEHQNVPFEKLVEHLHPARTLSRTPLVQVFFNMLSQADVQIAFPGITVEHVQFSAAGSKFDLTLYVKESPKGSELKLVYNEDIFSRVHMEELLEQYEQLLRQIAQNPGGQINSFSLVTPRARACLPDPSQTLQVSWSGSIPERLSQRASQVPRKLAVVDKHTSWTYAELEARSNQLAHYLRSTGVKPQGIVVVYAHRDASLVWALLGVLKAGAAFLILDPAYPTPRLLERLRLVAPQSWLQLERAGELPSALESYLANLRCPRFVLPANSHHAACATLQHFPASAPAVRIEPDDLAYLAFTSGTTGEQKAILGSHRPLSHFLEWHCTTFGFSQSDRFSMLSGLSHDPMLRDIFAPLWVGATLYTPDQLDFEASGQLAQWMTKHKISIAHLTPAIGRWLCESVSVKMQSLRYGFFGGDILTGRDISTLQQIAPKVKCVNFYGATETPQAMGYYTPEDEAVRQPSADSITKLPLGRGIADVQLLVLNECQQLTGIGELGEICVRTPYLAKGYQSDPALTQEKFVPNPFTGMPEDRMYRTGDLGRVLPDGNIQLAGRRDDQVKIRGFRIELGEVAACLNEHPEISQVIVVANEDSRGDKGLIAYFVPKPETTPTHLQLRDFLQQRLPEFMLPSAFVALDSLPRTPNGKTDRCALPSPSEFNTASQTVFVSPRDPLELQLTEIWESVLGHQPVGVQDNFFELGGHSLLAVRLFARIEQALGRHLPLATLFKAPTIEQLAAVFRQRGWKEAWSSLVPIQLGGSRTPFFCVHGVGGNVLNFRDLARHLGADQPVYGLQAIGLDGNHAPLTSFEEMAAHYIREIQALQPEGPYLVGGLSFGGLIAYEIACQLETQGQKVALVALFDTGSRGNFESLSQSEIYQRQLNFYWRRIKYNLHRLVFGPQRLAYLHGKSKTVRRKIESKVWQTNHKLHDFAGQPLPRGYAHVKQINYLASKSFVPKLYAGRVALFRAQERPISYHLDETLGWNRLAQGGVDVFETPGTHTTLILEPHVPFLARRLRACIEEALLEDLLLQANSGS